MLIFNEVSFFVILFVGLSDASCRVEYLMSPFFGFV